MKHSQQFPLLPDFSESLRQQLEVVTIEDIFPNTTTDTIYQLFANIPVLYSTELSNRRISLTVPKIYTESILNYKSTIKEYTGGVVNVGPIGYSLVVYVPFNSVSKELSEYFSSYGTVTSIKKIGGGNYQLTSTEQIEYSKLMINYSSLSDAERVYADINGKDYFECEFCVRAYRMYIIKDDKTPLFQMKKKNEQIQCLYQGMGSTVNHPQSPKIVSPIPAIPNPTQQFYTPQRYDTQETNPLLSAYSKTPNRQLQTPAFVPKHLKQQQQISPSLQMQNVSVTPTESPNGILKKSYPSFTPFDELKTIRLICTIPPTWGLEETKNAIRDTGVEILKFHKRTVKGFGSCATVVVYQGQEHLLLGRVFNETFFAVETNVPFNSLNFAIDKDIQEQINSLNKVFVTHTPPAFNTMKAAELFSAFGRILHIWVDTKKQIGFITYFSLKTLRRLLASKSRWNVRVTTKTVISCFSSEKPHA
ncbi:hypothetical protein EIN_369410 [Entamoeba invadens IP1]|uniref:RRM domain-containing protein n=1 Tax=Entamoeba invadens IP1 TaxID=370355 RepID=A0A0A1UFA0_ENTIV|nr:hypothetical protein EIN_369410 [Entamoeba invadens IP1]ELP92619.1 hypothetical protein EIN_369410 [Entamoeba invadens IP1]|eukprot:XP_004259390.1 hypothetical protein EIN_369410 [Entamoeba invadens IP1]